MGARFRDCPLLGPFLVGNASNVQGGVLASTVHFLPTIASTPLTTRYMLISTLHAFLTPSFLVHPKRTAIIINCSYRPPIPISHFSTNSLCVNYNRRCVHFHYPPTQLRSLTPPQRIANPNQCTYPLKTCLCPPYSYFSALFLHKPTFYSPKINPPSTTPPKNSMTASSSPTPIGLGGEASNETESHPQINPHPLNGNEIKTLFGKHSYPVVDIALCPSSETISSS